jgi:molybdopterin molybdotransferase
LISIEQALALVADVVAAGPRTRLELVPLRDAAGRVLATDVVAALDLPPFDRATMDGWAIPAGGAAGPDERGRTDQPGRPEGGDRRYRVTGVINAGDTATIAAATGEGAPPLAPGTAMKVMTGAPVPPGTARVVPVELAREAAAGGTREPAARDRHETAAGGRAGRADAADHAAAATLPAAIEIVPEAGPIDALPRCIHPRGQDLRCDDLAARAGERITALRLADLLACGVSEVRAYRRPRVSIATTGDELVESAADLAPGRILDTNSPLLRLVLEGRGYPATVHRAIPDDRAAVRERIAGMLGQANAVILTGGVSMGDRDFVPEALRSLGLTIHFDRVAIQPGKPALLATGERGVVFALPGNPVSAFVTLHLLVLPALALMEGARVRPRFLTLNLAEPWRGGAGDRVRLFPARLTAGGGVVALPYHGSGHLRALVEADGLLRIDPEREQLAAGEPVPFWPVRVGAFEGYDEVPA